MHAGAALARAVEPACVDLGRNLPRLVVGLARGGVVVAAEVARALRAELGALVVKKIGIPGNPEAALGAAVEDGTVVLDPAAERILSRDAIAATVGAALAAARESARRLRAGSGRPSVAGRLAIVVDDGIATGSTVAAAVRALSLDRPAALLVAAPVASLDAVERLASDPAVARVICPYAPENFFAVGQFYADFEQVEDEEVASLLARASSGKSDG